MTKIITLYNHKGGVSKTTTTFNLAHALAEARGRRVLVVDADPQCNLTELVLSRVIEELDAKEGIGAHTELPGSTITDALNPRLTGERPDVDVNAIVLATADENFPVFLLRGDISLNEAEDKLSYAHSQRLTSDLHQRRSYVAIHDMLRRLGDLHELDYILVDVGPSAGALTRSFFLSCDAYLVPVAPDRFNFQAIGSLSEILRKWITEHRMIVDDFRKLKLNVSEGQPQLLGLVVQRFQRHAGKPKPGFRVWMDRIPQRVREELVPKLIAATGTQDVIAGACLSNPTASEIPDFASLGPMMLTFAKPVWRLTKEETEWQGKVWDDRKEEIERFRDRFFRLAAYVDDTLAGA
ncbi:MAG TPA: ParA family protein [Longimicrobium sp.]|jgi:cellulose biosynthesis protein BcsQ|uniref:ParA family protein n=1 Tax=Longimicrobium sp. TaxID=2029185 RepID=UPI002ED9723B